MITKNIYKVPLVESIFFLFFGAVLRLQWTRDERDGGTNAYELNCDDGRAIRAGAAVVRKTRSLLAVPC